MPPLENISITFSFNWLFFSLFLLLIAAYTFINYRITIPEISAWLKSVLIVIRSLALILILFLIFEPILTITEEKRVEPVHYVFLDNSESITFDDGSGRTEIEKQFIESLLSRPASENVRFFSFGDNTAPFYPDSLDTLSFREGRTNLSNVFQRVENSSDNVASVILISDGVITDGGSPLYTAEDLGIPVFTIGLGDSARMNDAAVSNVLYNEFMYVNTPTSVIAVINNRGFGGEPMRIRLFEENRLIDERTVTLSNEGLNNVELDYTPTEAGERRLTVVAEPFDSEFSKENNRKSFFVTVFDNKLRIVLLAGAPSPDIGFLTTTLEQDTNLTVTTIIQAAPDVYLGTPFSQIILDEADIFYLINFPSNETPVSVINAVREQIAVNEKPFFFLLSTAVDPGKLSMLKEELPFTIVRSSNSVYEAQPDIKNDESDNPLIQYGASDIIEGWNDLAPIYMPAYEIEPKGGSNVIATANVNNVSIANPLLLTRRFGGNRSIALLAGGVYKWKLRTTEMNKNLFDHFIHNSITWLNTRDDKKQVRITTSRKFYKIGERVQISAEVYNAMFNPVDNASVTVTVNNGSERAELKLNSLGGGKYEGFYDASATGDYYYSGKALLNEKTLGTDKGRFNVGEVNRELINPFINSALLQLLAERTGGAYYYGDNYRALFETLENISARSENVLEETSETALWADYRLLIVIIILLGLEWFLRKREGMI